MERREFVKQVGAGGTAIALGAHHLGALEAAAPVGVQPLVDGWLFVREDLTEAEALHSGDDTGWETVTLPHTAKVEALVTGAPGSGTAQWQGRCWYRRTIPAGTVAPGQQAWLRLEGAMNVADVYLDGQKLGTHLGGYTPFVYDLTGKLASGKAALLAVRLDNTDNAITGPKPMADLDFNMYGGLYRGVSLIVKDALHITDPALADKTASGGVLVHVPAASAERASVRVQLHVRNASAGARTFQLRHRLENAAGTVVASVTSKPLTLAAGADNQFTDTLDVARPALWHPRTPHLHTVHSDIIDDARLVDTETTRIGIRRFDITKDGCRINGDATFLRGTNRHQDYPYIGYALSDAAQRRDARKIKEAGFDYIRLSHYLHAPAFMDACDELGIVVMNCLPGWQYFGKDPAFTELQYANIRSLIRRDRNHACVLLWEVSLNETGMPPEFIARTHALAHDELPGDQTFTCGWMRGYDVFIQARQHGGCVGVTDVPCLVSEYGDWEYYAQNAGLNQTAWAGLAPDDANSRQLRWHGEKRLLQQATNFQEAHNDNRKTTAFADGLWVMNDYNRGYAPDIESSGCADLWRIPKFSYHFFRSQRPATERYANADSGPMVFIASHWTPASALTVRVFSNADEVALSLNGTLIARQKPDADRLSTHLAHPPFTFALPRFEAGTLEAVAFVAGKAVAKHAVRTPGAPTVLTLRLDESGQPFALKGKDSAFVHASLVDVNGTLVSDAWENVSFGAVGNAKLIGANPYSSEAGIASIVLQAERARTKVAVYALACVTSGDTTRVLASALGVGITPTAFTLHVTTDGSAPSAASPRYTAAVPANPPLRVALAVGREVVVTARADAPRFRVAGSTAPKPGS